MMDYATKFQGRGAVERYQRKLGNRLDALRHRIELEILQRYACGDLYDCTIGIGRFVGRLPKVTSYRGMDFSPEFVAHVRETYPGVEASEGDLTRGVDAPSESFDTVLLLRSLSAIGHEERILSEMVRIARPGGVVIFDYGRRPTEITLNGRTMLADAAPIDAIIKNLPVRLVEGRKVDGVLTRLKKHGRLFKELEVGVGRFIPDVSFAVAERLLAPLLWERQIFIAEKRGS